jgi:hypothetical protein
MQDGRNYARGMSIFRTSHLSIYAVVYDRESDGDIVDGEEIEEGEEDAVRLGGGGCDAGSGAAGWMIFALWIALAAKTGKPATGKSRN